jgi:hypothetical protein
VADTDLPQVAQRKLAQELVYEVAVGHARGAQSAEMGRMFRDDPRPRPPRLGPAKEVGKAPEHPGQRRTGLAGDSAPVGAGDVGAHHAPALGGDLDAVALRPQEGGGSGPQAVTMGSTSRLRFGQPAMALPAVTSVSRCTSPSVAVSMAMAASPCAMRWHPALIRAAIALTRACAAAASARPRRIIASESAMAPSV